MVAAMSSGLGMVVVVSTLVATILTQLVARWQRGQRANWSLDGTGAHMVGCVLSG